MLHDTVLARHIVAYHRYQSTKLDYLHHLQLSQRFVLHLALLIPENLLHILVECLLYFLMKGYHFSHFQKLHSPHYFDIQIIHLANCLKGMLLLRFPDIHLHCLQMYNPKSVIPCLQLHKLHYLFLYCNYCMLSPLNCFQMYSQTVSFHHR